MAFRDFIRKAGTAALGAGLMLCVADAASAKDVTLRMGNWLPPSHHMQNTLKQWIAEVEKATGGTVKIDLMKAPLAGSKGQYDLVKNGIVDISYSVAAYNPQRFKLFRAIEVPFMMGKSAPASAALFDWYTSNGLDKREFQGTKLIAAFTAPNFLVHSRKPLHTLKDFEGLKIRAGGNGIAIFKKLGAAPVFLSPGDTTEALQRGTIDATQFTWEALSGFRMGELVHDHLVISGGLYGTGFWVAMNERAWNKLSPEQQKAIESVGISGSRLIGEGWDKAEAKGKAEAEAVARGDTIVTLDPAETDKLKQITQFITGDWIKTADGEGLDGKALLKKLRAKVAQDSNE